MRSTKYILFVAFLILTVLLAGCGGRGNKGENGGNGGNGGVTSDYTLNVTISPAGAGAVLLIPSGGRYAKDTEVTLTPAAGEGYEFSGWAGPNGAEVVPRYDRWTIKMNGNKQVTAAFSELRKDQVAAPIASPLGGKVPEGTEITLTTTTDKATIYYTVDGTEPTAGSTVYSDDQKPVVPARGMTLKAFAVKEGMVASQIKTFVYTAVTVEPIEQDTCTVGGVSFNMRQAPAGLTFPIGMYSETATIDYAFFIGETEVTYELWLVVYNWATDEVRGTGRYYFQRTGQAGSSGVYFAGEQDPVTSISWRDALVWCNALTEYYNAEKGKDWACVYIDSEGKPIRDSRDANGDVCDQATALPTAKGFRLPTSAEWELAARYINGIDWLPYNHASGDLSGTCYPPEEETTTRLGEYVWYAENSGGTTHPVATKKSNPFGLFDMSGNVSEMCYDRHWLDATRRVERGGNCWSPMGRALMISNENWIVPDVDSSLVGFRLARTD